MVLDAVTDSWNPEQYHRFQTERSQPFFDLLALVEPSAAPRVADLGCGTGELTAEAHTALAARETVGIDQSPAMLAQATKLDVAGLTFREGDLAQFSDADGFDVVIANAALQWVPDHAGVLARWRDALTDAGQVAVQMPTNADHPSHWVAREIAEEQPFLSAFDGAAPGDPVQGNVLAPEEYAQLLDDLGFSHQHVRLQVYPHHLDSTDEVVEWVKGTSLTRFQRAMSEDRYALFLDRYRARLIEVLGDHRPYLYTFKRILFWARKRP
jgi:trans-aconitate 2-methyltransferase